MSDISRRSFMRNAAIGAATVGTLGLMAGCAPKQEEPAPQANADAPADGATANVLDPKTMPDAATASNFNVVEESATAVGTTLENLKTAIEGETGATTKYAAWAKVAETAGYDHIARLFTCTSDAEKIHIELEYKLVQKLDPGYEKPEPPEVPEHTVDLNLIAGANGEIYETSDMYPPSANAQLWGVDVKLGIWPHAVMRIEGDGPPVSVDLHGDAAGGALGEAGIHKADAVAAEV